MERRQQQIRIAAFVYLCPSPTNKSQVLWLAHRRNDLRTLTGARGCRHEANRSRPSSRGGSRASARRRRRIQPPVRTCAAGANHPQLGQALTCAGSRAASRSQQPAVWRRQALRRATRRRSLVRQDPRTRPSAALSRGRAINLKRPAPSQQPSRPLGRLLLWPTPSAQTYGRLNAHGRRDGATILLAAHNILDGTVIVRPWRRYRREGFIRFFNAVERAVSAGVAADRQFRRRRHSRELWAAVPSRPQAQCDQPYDLTFVGRC